MALIEFFFTVEKHNDKKRQSHLGANKQKRNSERFFLYMNLGALESLFGKISQPAKKRFPQTVKHPL